MMLFTLLTIACCCGLPYYYGKPMWDQYPAKATLPAELAGLKLRDDATSQQTAQQLKREMRTAHMIAEDTFAAVYGNSRGRRITVFGATGFRFSPDQDLDAEVQRLTSKYGLTKVQSYDTGVRGEYQQCGTGRMDGVTIVLCSWADHGSIGTVIFTQLSITDSVDRLPELRASIVTRD